MDYSNDEWAPITDADLLGDEGVAEVVRAPVAPPPRDEPEEIVCLLPPASPAPTRRRLRGWVRTPKPVYTAEDWRIFNYWVRQPGYSIDMAAHCAGIAVYDALHSLMIRSPLFYEFKIVVSPSGRSDVGTRRRKGVRHTTGGMGKNYVRREVKYQRKKTETESRAPGRLTEDEARERFLALLGDRHPSDRVDGVADYDHPNKHKSTIHPGSGDQCGNQVRFTSTRTGQQDLEQ